MSTGTDSPPRLRRILAAAVAIVLVSLVLVAAGPREVWQMLRATQLLPLLAAAAAAALALLARGARLAMLLPSRRLGIFRSTAAAAASQAAALFVPARLGELALPLLLRRLAGCDLATGVATLLAVRALDVAGLGVWSGAAVLAVWGLDQPVALLIAALLLAPGLMLRRTLRAADAIALRVVAPRGLAGRRWARRLRRMARAVDELHGRPARLAGALAVSLVMWAFLWALAFYLLRALGHHWPLGVVVAGSAAASLANLLPINVIGNFGTLEAGWTAAFVALGIPLETAAATGLVCHLWALVFAAIYGALAWLSLESTA